MKYIPILFSTPMVQAILEGRKTMTRRISAVPVGDHYGTDIMDWGMSVHPHLENGEWKYTVQTDVDDSDTHILKCRFGKPGDILWVRETWGVGTRPDPLQGWVDGYEFKADEKYADEIEPVPLYKTDLDISGYKSGWKPSIHMPKDACRIFLQVTDIRVERLQDITESDAEGEGVQSNACENESLCISNLCKQEGCSGKGQYYKYSTPMDFDAEPCYSAKESFQSFWESINGDESWDSNPWVWVVSFKRIDKPADFVQQGTNLQECDANEAKLLTDAK